MISPEMIRPAPEPSFEADSGPPAADSGSGLPEPIAALLEGRPAALTVPPVRGRSPDPTISFLQANFASLAESGIDYLDLDDGSTVLFNTGILTRGAIEAAQAEGRLAEIAPPLGAAAPSAATPDEAMVAPAPAADLSGFTMPSVSNETPVARARAAKMKPKQPTERPMPGAGQVANDVASRAI
jgi:hypothetical protein